jgi:cAMP-dependent protein kinase regulator
VVDERPKRDDLERAAEAARIAGRDDQAFALFEELVADDLREGRIARAVSIYQKIVLWRPQSREVHRRLAEQIGNARESTGANPDRPGGSRLPESSLFQGIPAEQLPEILQGMRPRKFNAGAEIVREGDPGESLFLITGGSASVNTHDEDGSFVALATLGIGDFFGEVSLLTSRPRTATVRAETAVESLELTRDSLTILRGRFPGIDKALSDFHELRARKTVESIIAQRRNRP